MDPIAPIAPVMAASAAVTTAGLLSLRASRQRAPGWMRRAMLGLALVCLVLGLAVAGCGWSWQIGIPIWIGLAGACGFAVTLAAGLRGGAPAAPARSPRAGTPAPQRATMRPVAGWALAAAVLGGGLASVAVALALAAWLPAHAADRAVLSVTLWPVLWAWGICHLYAAPSRPRACAEVACVTAVAAFALAGGFPG